MRLKQLRKEYQDKRAELEAQVVQRKITPEQLAIEYKKLDKSFQRQIRRLEAKPGKKNFILILAFAMVALMLLVVSIALFYKKQLDETIYSLFGFVLMMFCAFYISLKENNRLRKLFFEFVSKTLGEKFIHRVPGFLEDELKPVALLHVGIKNYATEFSDLDDADILDVMSAYFSLVTSVVHKYGGIIYGVYIGNIRATFDLDDEEEPLSCIAALQAAFEIEKVVREKAGSGDFIGKTLFPGIGMHYGKTVIGNIGSEDFTIYAPVGLSVKITERLKKAATYGEILVSQDVADEAEEYFNYSSKEPMALPGGRQIVRIFRANALYLERIDEAVGV